MSDLLGPMPPTPDEGPVAPDAGRLEPIAPGVFVWLGTDGAGRPGPNAGVIVEADGITVVDTLSAPSAARALNERLKGFGVPVRRAVYTSSHVDSVGGSSVFWMAARYGRAQTSALLDQPVPLDAYRRLVPAYAAEFDDDFATRPVSHTVASAAWLTPLVCAVPVSGPQSENLVVLVPSAGVLFAGAVAVFGTTPNAYDGDPEGWADTLGELGDQAPVVVPGVGPVGDAGHLLVLQAYLYATADAEGDPRRIPDGPWDEWSDRDLDEVNVERAARLAQGDDAVPEAMLRRLGLA
ncbi:MBL fold metallo-hydrolase [Rhabdothermincola salaria]|uniref:MBL fold metallo-hydrolase n=1 Tax=Rhabdothermincola salaria TaxID=2903142 RepID=UPI001E59AE8E|nr:MBL fold metallo-hydrolase [Rhabdothermincola salaria]MCD9622296.1 MBL fold metallo-hydrolase [Rhabdothermincola salaria]